MTSVAQRKSIRIAICGLTCLMLSACPSHTIVDALFERLLIVDQYSKNDIQRLYEICTHIYRLLQQPNENTNSLYNEQRMINSSSII
ncbi:unnamed protein product [Rotaria sp. Silwood1]|nr:unnamed protein product [Rotaria sp. Silwood1]